MAATAWSGRQGLVMVRVGMCRSDHGPHSVIPKRPKNRQLTGSVKFGTHASGGDPIVRWRGRGVSKPNRPCVSRVRRRASARRNSDVALLATLSGGAGDSRPAASGSDPREPDPAPAAGSVRTVRTASGCGCKSAERMRRSTAPSRYPWRRTKRFGWTSTAPRPISFGAEDQDRGSRPTRPTRPIVKLTGWRPTSTPHRPNAETLPVNSKVQGSNP